MADLDDRMRARIDAFVAELTELVRQATFEKLAAALESPDGVPSKVAGRDGARAGGKRTAPEIEAQCARILAFVSKHPGQGAEAIAQGLGTSPRGLTLALKRLMANRQITRKGQKRATRYFAA
jgi:hypothetical protein